LIGGDGASAAAPAQAVAAVADRQVGWRRRLQVAALRELGAPTRVIAELVGRDPSLIRGDLRAIGQHARPAMQQNQGFGVRAS
jgi:hypothetical protein